MKTIKETLELALEALEWMVENDDTNEGDEPIDRLGGQSWNEYNSYWLDGLNNARASITALREALTSVPDWASEAIDQPSGEATLAPVQKEPVEIVSSKAMTDADWDRLLDRTAQRKPLTYEEITTISKQVAEGGPNNSIDRFARAIEAAHDIKEENT